MPRSFTIEFTKVLLDELEISGIAPNTIENNLKSLSLNLELV